MLYKDGKTIKISSVDTAAKNYLIAQGWTLPSPYSAQIISHNIPTQMEAGRSYQVSVTVRNTGSNSWTATGGYRLGGVGDSDPFAEARRYLSSGESIDIGESKTFTFTMTAPTTPGTYTTDWRMLREGFTWFGGTVAQQVAVQSNNEMSYIKANNAFYDKNGIVPLNMVPNIIKAKAAIQDIGYMICGTTCNLLNSNNKYDRFGSSEFYSAVDSFMEVYRPFLKPEVFLDREKCYEWIWKVYNGDTSNLNAYLLDKPLILPLPDYADPDYYNKYIFPMHFKYLSRGRANGYIAWEDDVFGIGVMGSFWDGMWEGTIDSFDIVSAIKGLIEAAKTLSQNPEQLKELAILSWKLSMPNPLFMDEKKAVLLLIAGIIEAEIEEFNNCTEEEKARRIGYFAGSILGELLFDAATLGVGLFIGPVLESLNILENSTKLVKQAIASAIDLIKKGIRNSDELGDLIKTVANAINKIKTAIKTSTENLGNAIKRVFSSKDGLVDLELADANGGSLGRFKINEQCLIDDADTISRQRWKNYCEASWAETSEAGVIDAEESLINGQHYTKNGKIKVLKPNVTYTTNGYSYTTDSLGRIKSASGKLSLNEAPRNPYAQTQAGRVYRLEGDQGGHLIASRFNGSGNLDNLVAMDGNLNQGVWKTMENKWADAIAKGQEVSVNIEPIYNGVSERPTDFIVEYYIDGKYTKVTFENIAGGGL